MHCRQIVVKGGSDDMNVYHMKLGPPCKDTYIDNIGIDRVTKIYTIPPHYK